MYSDPNNRLSSLDNTRSFCSVITEMCEGASCAYHVHDCIIKDITNEFADSVGFEDTYDFVVITYVTKSARDAKKHSFTFPLFILQKTY